VFQRFWDSGKTTTVFDAGGKTIRGTITGFDGAAHFPLHATFALFLHVVTI